MSYFHFRTIYKFYFYFRTICRIKLVNVQTLKLYAGIVTRNSRFRKFYLQSITFNVNNSICNTVNRDVSICRKYNLSILKIMFDPMYCKKSFTNINKKIFSKKKIKLVCDHYILVIEIGYLILSKQ